MGVRGACGGHRGLELGLQGATGTCRGHRGLTLAAVGATGTYRHHRGLTPGVLGTSKDLAPGLLPGAIGPILPSCRAAGREAPVQCKPPPACPCSSVRAMLVVVILFINYSMGAVEPPQLPGSGTALPCGWAFLYRCFYRDTISVGNIFLRAHQSL